MKKIVFLSYIILHLLLVTFNNTMGVLKNYFNYYYGVENELCKKVRFSAFEILSPLWFYETYASTTTSYGFYAPSVASDFLVTYYPRVTANGREKSIGARFMPTFERSESELRFRICYRFFQRQLEHPEPDEQIDKMVTVLMQLVSKDIRKEFPLSEKMLTKCYLQVQPSIREYSEGKRPSLSIMHRFEFN